jgi:hypothetical protein
MAQTLGQKFKLLKGPFELIGSYGLANGNDIYFATDKGIIKANGQMIGAHAVQDASILEGTNTLQINFIDGTNTTVDLSGINLAQTLKNELIGQAGDASNANTIYGAKKYAEDFAKAYADASINGLDVADISTAGQAIIAVGQTDGKIHAIAGNIAAANVTIADASGNFAAETVEAALAELATGAATYSFTKVTDGLANNVLEAWQLVETKNDVSSNVGDPINIYKDSALLGVKVTKSGIQWTNNAWGADPTTGDDVLALAYEDKNGTVQVVELNVANFLRESEFKDGLQVTSGEVSVKIDANSEDFLTVSSTGVKLDGVQTAINTAKNGLIGTDADSLVGDSSTLTLKSLRNKVLNLDGTDVKIATGYAKADSATGVAANDTVNVAFGKVEKQIDSLGADAVKSVTVNGQNASVTNNNASVTIDGADIALDGYTKGSAEAAIAATDTVNGALGKLEYKADTNKAAIDLLNGPDTSVGSVAKSIKDAIEGLDVSDTSVANQYVAEVSEADGKISVVRAAIPVIGVEDASVASQVAINAKLDSNSKVSTDKANLTSITLGGYSTTGIAAANVAATDTLGTAIAKIEAMLSWTVVTADA